MSDRINVTLLTFHRAPSGNPRTLALGNVFDSIHVQEMDGKPVLRPIQILMHVNIIGSNDGSPSHMEAGEGRILFTLRLVKDSISESRRIGVELARYTMDLSQMDAAICGTSFHFINYMHIFDTSSFRLDPGYGKYQLKVCASWLDDEGNPIEEPEVVSVYEFSVQG